MIVIVIIIKVSITLVHHVHCTSHQSIDDTQNEATIRSISIAASNGICLSLQFLSRPCPCISASPINQ